MPVASAVVSTACLILERTRRSLKKSAKSSTAITTAAKNATDNVSIVETARTTPVKKSMSGYRRITYSAGARIGLGIFIEEEKEEKGETVKTKKWIATSASQYRPSVKTSALPDHKDHHSNQRTEDGARNSDASGEATPTLRSTNKSALVSVDERYTSLSDTYQQLTICPSCYEFFPSDEAKGLHVQTSEKHPRCKKCDCGFSNDKALIKHYVMSPEHKYCAGCKLEFDTSAALEEHELTSPAHENHNDDEADVSSTEGHSSQCKGIVSERVGRFWMYRMCSTYPHTECSFTPPDIKITTPTPRIESNAELFQPTVLDPNYLLPHRTPLGLPVLRLSIGFKRSLVAGVVRTPSITIFVTPPTPESETDAGYFPDFDEYYSGRVSHRSQRATKLCLINDGEEEYLRVMDRTGRIYKINKEKLREGYRMRERGRSRIRAHEVTR